MRLEREFRPFAKASTILEYNHCQADHWLDGYRQDTNAYKTERDISYRSLCYSANVIKKCLPIDVLESLAMLRRGTGCYQILIKGFPKDEPISLNRPNETLPSRGYGSIAEYSLAGFIGMLSLPDTPNFRARPFIAKVPSGETWHISLCQKSDFKMLFNRGPHEIIINSVIPDDFLQNFTDKEKSAFRTKMFFTKRGGFTPIYKEDNKENRPIFDNYALMGIMDDTITSEKKHVKPLRKLIHSFAEYSQKNQIVLPPQSTLVYDSLHSILFVHKKEFAQNFELNYAHIEPLGPAYTKMGEIPEVDRSQLLEDLKKFGNGYRDYVISENPEFARYIKGSPMCNLFAKRCGF